MRIMSSPYQAESGGSLRVHRQFDSNEGHSKFVETIDDDGLIVKRTIIVPNYKQKPSKPRISLSDQKNFEEANAFGIFQDEVGDQRYYKPNMLDQQRLRKIARAEDMLRNNQKLAAESIRQTQKAMSAFLSNHQSGDGLYAEDPYNSSESYPRLFGGGPSSPKTLTAAERKALLTKYGKLLIEAGGLKDEAFIKVMRDGDRTLKNIGQPGQKAQIPYRINLIEKLLEMPSKLHQKCMKIISYINKRLVQARETTDLERAIWDTYANYSRQAQLLAIALYEKLGIFNEDIEKAINEVRKKERKKSVDEGRIAQSPMKPVRLASPAAAPRKAGSPAVGRQPQPVRISPPNARPAPAPAQKVAAARQTPPASRMSLAKGQVPPVLAPKVFAKRQVPAAPRMALAKGQLPPVKVAKAAATRQAAPAPRMSLAKGQAVPASRMSLAQGQLPRAPVAKISATRQIGPAPQMSPAKGQAVPAPRMYLAKGQAAPAPRMSLAKGQAAPGPRMPLAKRQAAPGQRTSLAKGQAAPVPVPKAPVARQTPPAIRKSPPKVQPAPVAKISPLRRSPPAARMSPLMRQPLPIPKVSPPRKSPPAARMSPPKVLSPPFSVPKGSPPRQSPPAVQVSPPQAQPLHAPTDVSSPIRSPSSPGSPQPSPEALSTQAASEYVGTPLRPSVLRAANMTKDFMLRRQRPVRAPVQLTPPNKQHITSVLDPLRARLWERYRQAENKINQAYVSKSEIERTHKLMRMRDRLNDKLYRATQEILETRTPEDRYWGRPHIDPAPEPSRTPEPWTPPTDAESVAFDEKNRQRLAQVFPRMYHEEARPLHPGEMRYELHGENLPDRIKQLGTGDLQRTIGNRLAEHRGIHSSISKNADQVQPKLQQQYSRQGQQHFSPDFDAAQKAVEKEKIKEIYHKNLKNVQLLIKDPEQLAYAVDRLNQQYENNLAQLEQKWARSPVKEFDSSPEQAACPIKPVAESHSGGRASPGPFSPQARQDLSPKQNQELIAAEKARLQQKYYAEVRAAPSKYPDPLELADYISDLKQKLDRDLAKLDQKLNESIDQIRHSSFGDIPETPVSTKRYSPRTESAKRLPKRASPITRLGKASTPKASHWISSPQPLSPVQYNEDFITSEKERLKQKYNEDLRNARLKIKNIVQLALHVARIKKQYDEDLAALDPINHSPQIESPQQIEAPPEVVVQAAKQKLKQRFNRDLNVIQKTVKNPIQLAYQMTALQDQYNDNIAILGKIARSMSAENASRSSHELLKTPKTPEKSNRIDKTLKKPPEVLYGALKVEADKEKLTRKFHRDCDIARANIKNPVKLAYEIAGLKNKLDNDIENLVEKHKDERRSVMYCPGRAALLLGSPAHQQSSSQEAHQQSSSQDEDSGSEEPSAKRYRQIRPATPHPSKPRSYAEILAAKKENLKRRFNRDLKKARSDIKNPIQLALAVGRLKNQFDKNMAAMKLKENELSPATQARGEESDEEA